MTIEYVFCSDGDWITLADDDDLHLALELGGKGILPMQVTDSKTPVQSMPKIDEQVGSVGIQYIRSFLTPLLPFRCRSSAWTTSRLRQLRRELIDGQVSRIRSLSCRPSSPRRSGMDLSRRPILRSRRPIPLKCRPIPLKCRPIPRSSSSLQPIPRSSSSSLQPIPLRCRLDVFDLTLACPSAFDLFRWVG
jgi:hypothetical protein